jgi:hypothetical protein
VEQVGGILKLFGNYEKGRLLGVGGSGIVHEFTNKQTGVRYALKEIEIQNKGMKNLVLNSLTRNETDNFHDQLGCRRSGDLKARVRDGYTPEYTANREGKHFGIVSQINVLCS